MPELLVCMVLFMKSKEKRGYNISFWHLYTENYWGEPERARHELRFYLYIIYIYIYGRTYVFP